MRSTFHRSHYIVQVEVRQYTGMPGYDDVRTLNYCVATPARKGDRLSFDVAGLGTRHGAVVGLGRKRGYTGPLKLAWREGTKRPASAHHLYFAGPCVRHNATEACRFCMGSEWPRLPALQRREPVASGSAQGQQPQDASDALLALLPPAAGVEYERALARAVERYMAAPFSVDETLAFIAAVDDVDREPAPSLIEHIDAQASICIKGTDPGRCVCDACCGHPVGHRTPREQRIDNARVRREAEYRAADQLMPSLEQRMADAEAEVARQDAGCDECSVVVTMGSGARQRVCSGACVPNIMPQTQAERDEVIAAKYGELRATYSGTDAPGKIIVLEGQQTDTWTSAGGTERVGC